MRVGFSAEIAQNVSWASLFPVRGWGSPTMTSIGKFVCMAHHFILLWLNPFGLRVDNEGLWLEHEMLSLRVGWSREGAKNVSWFRLSSIRGWGSLTMTSTGKLVCMAHQFILLLLNPIGLRVDSERCWFVHSMS